MAAPRCPGTLVAPSAAAGVLVPALVAEAAASLQEELTDGHGRRHRRATATAASRPGAGEQRGLRGEGPAPRPPPLCVLRGGAVVGHCPVALG